jgi:Na+/phosphate symporter
MIMNAMKISIILLLLLLAVSHADIAHAQFWKRWFSKDEQAQPAASPAQEKDLQAVDIDKKAAEEEQLKLADVKPVMLDDTEEIYEGEELDKEEELRRTQERVDQIRKIQEINNMQRSLDNIRRINEQQRQQKSIEEINRLNRMQQNLDRLRRTTETKK